MAIADYFLKITDIEPEKRSAPTTAADVLAAARPVVAQVSLLPPTIQR